MDGVLVGARLLKGRNKIRVIIERVAIHKTVGIRDKVTDIIAARRGAVGRYVGVADGRKTLRRTQRLGVEAIRDGHRTHVARP